MTVFPVFFVLVLVLHAASLCLAGNDCLKPKDQRPTLICPAGSYIKWDCSGNVTCEKCASDFYLELSNKLQECLPCRSCDSGLNMIVKSDCTPQRDRVCDCKKGTFRKKTFKDEFRCEDCKKCSNCSKCLECKDNCKPVSCDHGQYLDEERQCQPCPKNQCIHETCKSFCKKDEPKSHWLELVILFPILLLLGLLAVLVGFLACSKMNPCRHVFKKNFNLHNGCNGMLPNVQIPVEPDVHCNIQLPLPLTAEPPSKPETRHAQRFLDLDWKKITTPLIVNGDTKDPSRNEVQKDRWPAPILYAIIREVPVRRWKEFLRLLSVSDDQMERVELEVGPSFLEQQYQMLRLWSQRIGVELENIYSTLHYMDLSGCAQELQEKLQQMQGLLKDNKGTT